jgi:hypothetical protein
MALAINPTTPATLYAGTYDGVFKSTDSGGTWAAVNTGLTTLQVGALAINPTTPATLYAGTGGMYDGGGVFKSTDSGGTWAAANTGLTNLTVVALAINPTTPATLYAGTSGGGVFKSTNSGGTWTAINTGLTILYVRALAIDPTTLATLYAGTGGGVFKSTDSGGTWAAANTGLPTGAMGLPSNVLALAINPTTPATLYAGTNGDGVFKSTDSGGTWAAANTGLTSAPNVNALAINPTTPQTLYAGTSDFDYHGGVFKSTDSGGTWAAANTGLPNVAVNALALDPTGATTLYAGLQGQSVWQLTPLASPGPTAVVSGTATICASGSTPIQAVLTGTGPWNVTWSDSVVQSGVATSPATRNVSPSSTTTYTVTALTDANSTAQAGDLTGSAVVTVGTTPGTPSPTNNGPKCVGDPVQLSVGIVTGATYAWTGPNGFTSTQALPTLSNVTTTMAGGYSVTVTVSGCTSAPGTTNVVVNLAPATPVITAPDSALPGTAGLTASVPLHAESSYLWGITNGTITSGTGTIQITFTAGTAGTPLTLSVTETNASGCVSAPGNATVTIAPAGSADLFYTLPPCRVLDTRNPTGPLGAPPFQPGATRTFDMAASTCGIPADAVAISANLIATNVGAPGELVVFPADVSRPNTTTISFQAGRFRANNAIVVFSKSSATFSVFNNSATTVDFILDVNGFFR